MAVEKQSINFGKNGTKKIKITGTMSPIQLKKSMRTGKKIKSLIRMTQKEQMVSGGVVEHIDAGII